MCMLLLIVSCAVFDSHNGENIYQAEHNRNNPLINGLNKTIDFYNISEHDIRQAAEIILGKSDEILEGIFRCS